MKKTILTILQYVIFLGLGIWIVYHMLHELSDKQTNDLIAAIKSINAWYLLPIFVVGFLSHFFRAVRWRYLLETVDVKPSLMNTTFAVLIGYIANLALPRAGEVAKCTVLARYEKMPAHKMIGTIVAERAFDVFCLIVIMVFAFFSQMHIISSYVYEIARQFSDKIKSHEAVLAGVVVALVLLIVVISFLYRRHKETKIGKLLKEMTHGILSIFTMKKRWEFLLYTFLIWFTYTLQIYIGLKSLPATCHLSLLVSIVVLVYGSVGMIVTPGGIGMYTFLVAEILGAYSISDAAAQAFGWIAWSVQTSIIVILGVISLLVIQSYNNKKNAKAGLDQAQNIQPS